MYVSIRHTKKTGGNCFATGYEIKAKEKNNFEMEIPEDGEVQVSISHLCGVSSDKLNLEVTGDLTVTYKLTPQLETTAAVEHFKYRFSEMGTLAFARPETRAYLRLDYEAGPWTGMLRGTWTGPMDLDKFYGTDGYNFDGTRKLSKSPSYWVVDLRGEYRLNKQWSTFLGIDNVFDFKQSDKESMLWVDGTGSFDVTNIWGPNRGRFIYGGVKFTL